MNASVIPGGPSVAPALSLKSIPCATARLKVKKTRKGGESETQLVPIGKLPFSAGRVLIECPEGQTGE